MKNIFLITIFIITLNCSGNKVANIHGFSFINEKFDKITVNNTNKNDVRSLIGPPSSISNFDDIWFYIERKNLSQSVAKLGKRKLDKNNILILTFNEKGLLAKKEILDINDMKDLEIDENVTKKKFNQNNLAYNILSTLREKINAPTRNRRK